MRFNWDAVTMHDIRLALGDDRVLDVVLDTGYTEVDEILDYIDLDEVEAVAAGEGLIASEYELSELFDDLIDDLDELERIKLCNDEPAFNEAFSNYVDSLASDSLLHPKQVQDYCYIGTRSFD